PSAADVALTQTLKQALDLIGVRVLDHLVIGEQVTSLSQRGLC
ncbi:DNA repair protein RadC, partial [mine drainage metagenome]